MPHEQVEQFWSRISCPTLLMHGANSRASNPQRDCRIRHFQNARVVEFEAAGHWLHHDRFDRFIAEPGGFL